MTWNNVLDYTDILTAIVDGLIPVLVLLRLRRLGFRLRSSSAGKLGIAFIAFFTLRVLQELHDTPGLPLSGNNFEFALDVLQIVALVAILLSTNKVVAAGMSTLERAELKENEYRRAMRDYTQVVRHRMGNPLTVVSGAAHTLKSGAVKDEAMHTQLCDVIIDMAEEMRRITLEPRRRDSLERELDAIPHVPEDDSPAPPKPALLTPASSSA